MGKIPKNPSDIFDEFIENYKDIYGDDLISIILFGSAAKNEYVYKKSDINFIVILSQNEINKLSKSISLIPKWQKRKVSTPLFLTKEYINSSLDSFPIEFFGMVNNYKVIYGEDVFQDINIKSKHLRLALERDIKGKLLHLREAFLNTAHNTKFIKQLIYQSLSDFTITFSALIQLKGDEIPQKQQQIFDKIIELFNLDSKVFNELFQIKLNNKKPAKQQFYELMESYIQEVQKLSIAVDQLN